MKTKVKWGIMSAASIATEAVIPAMVKGEYCEVYAIASRNLTKAQQVASQFNISKAYGSFQPYTWGLPHPAFQAIHLFCR